MTADRPHANPTAPAAPQPEALGAAVEGLLDAFRDGVIANEAARDGSVPKRIDAFQHAWEARQAIERAFAAQDATIAALRRSLAKVRVERC